MNIYLMEIKNIKQEDIKKELLSERAVKKYERLEKVNPEKAVQSAIADLILRYIAKKHNIRHIINESERGKPYFEDGGVNFSVAHSKNVVVVAENSENLGIDIEWLRDIKPGLAREVLNQFELARYSTLLTDGRKIRYFYRCFTEKESYVKFKGTGIIGKLCNIKSYEGGQFVTKYLFSQSDVYCFTACSSEINNMHFENITMKQLYEI